MKFVDLTGQRFGRLTVIKRVENNGKKVMWLCRCDCGNETTVFSGCLRAGHTKSCGCLNIYRIKERRFKHGESRKTRLYSIWKGIRKRTSGKEKDEESTIQNIPNSITSIDVNTLRNNTNDINSGNNGSSLDNLLNIGGQSNFITPAEKIVKTDTFDKQNKSKDYFSTADLSALNIPQETSNIVPINNGMIPTSNVAEENYTIEEATEKIRELVNDLKEHGVNINTDEMNFEKSYQIIIKLYKDNK